MNNDLSISALSESHLNTLIAYEAECLMASKTEYDTTFMDLCCDAFGKLQRSTVPSDEKIAEIGEKAYQEYIDNNVNYEAFDTTKPKILPARKPVRILIVTVLLLAALTFTVMAVWNPFSNWIADVKDRLNLNPGDIIENEDGKFSSDKTAQEFSSIDELENAIGIHFEFFDNIHFEPSSTYIALHGENKYIHIQYKIEEKQVILVIHLQNAPYYKEPMEQANLPKQILGDLEWHITEYDNYQTLVSFDDNYVYVVTADSLDTIQTLLKGNENEKID